MPSRSKKGPESLRLHRDRARVRELLIRERHQVQLLRAALVGVIAGLLSVAFQTAVGGAERVSAVLAASARNVGWLGWPAIILGAGFLGAVAAYTTQKLSPAASGSGIPHVKAVLLHLRTLLPWRLIPVKFGAGLLALTAGMSLGREGPTIQMGAAVGKLLGDLMRVPGRGLSALIAAGAGAGLASAFNAPLAGFLFVMEELKREMSPLTYGTALVGSVSGVAVSRVLLGQNPSFVLPTSSAPPLRALPLMAVLGLIAGVAGVAFNRSLIGAIRLRRRMKPPRWAVGASIGGLAGLCLLLLPEVTGPGHHVLFNLIERDQPASVLAQVALGLFLAKSLLTVLSYGSAVPGGIFAPLLAMGALLGFAFAQGLWLTNLDLGIGPIPFAIVGMAALLTSVVRAPLTGVVLIVEMTGEYPMLYSLLLACFVAYVVPEMVRDKPIYEALLEQDLHGDAVEQEVSSEPVLLDILVEPHSTLDGKAVREMGLPEGCLLVSVLRRDKHIVPAGSTIIESGDTLSVMAEGHLTEIAHAIHEASRAP